MVRAVRDHKNFLLKLYIGVDKELDSDGPAIVVADTGTGFRDSREGLIRPFFTRKPDGMGLVSMTATLL